METICHNNVTLDLRPLLLLHPPSTTCRTLSLPCFQGVKLLLQLFGLVVELLLSSFTSPHATLISNLDCGGFLRTDVPQRHSAMV